MSFINRLQHGWNAFIGRDPTPPPMPYGSSTRPDHYRLTTGNERSIVNATLNRIAVDVAAISIQHVQTDENGRYREPRQSALNECFTIAANTDQTARMFFEDAVLSLLDEGHIAIVPTRATENPMFTEGYDIGALRVGKVVEWFPQHVKVELYNEESGKKEQRIFPKAMVALPENPFYSIMNEPNSVYKRLVSKLRMLDIIDAQSSSCKLDIIIQVPYSTHSAMRKNQANERRTEIENQLTNSRYGIAYIDGSEKIIQLNRAVENNLFNQVEYYTNMLNSQLGMPPSVFDGSADEKVMLNYQNRTIEPIVSAIVDSMKWKFLSKTARTRGQSIMFFTDPLKLATAETLANSADKFIRNEILTKNEFRQKLGYKPSEDPSADKLMNPNMPVKDEEQLQQDNKIPNKQPNEDDAT